MTSPNKRPLLIDIDIPEECQRLCPTAKKYLENPNQISSIDLAKRVTEIDESDDMTFVAGLYCPGPTEVRVGVLRRKASKCLIEATSVVYHGNSQPAAGLIRKALDIHKE